jgi:hypothetical protein
MLALYLSPKSLPLGQLQNSCEFAHFSTLNSHLFVPIGLARTTVGAADLIRQAKDGDETALASLLSAHRDQLRHMADRALPDRLKARVDASDIVQQTCLSAFRQIALFEGSDPAQFAVWLRQIHGRNIKNVVRDQLQTQSTFGRLCRS